jgi:CheY-like chemotaxis protein
MSHELRTPLNSLLILAQQLAENPDHNLTPTQVEYASVIHTSGQDLLNLLNSILDLAKVESGTVVVELAPLSIEELRSDLAREFEHVARGKGLNFTVEVAANSPAEITTDPQRLRQILKNLLANAFKFTEQGHVHVEISLAEHGWSSEPSALTGALSVMALAVSDTGIGIDEKQQQRIFEPFAQGDGTTARLYGGTGLGLSISRELVSLLGGELIVASTPGQGSTFTVYVPSAPPVAAAVSPPSAAPALTASEPSSPVPGRDFAGTKVLVVDDDFRNIFAMTALLERANATVLVAESGYDALSILERTGDIDIVLMDIMMPVMDGYATIRAIRALEAFKALPIVALTGKVMPGERQRCLDAGANDFVHKPVDLAELIAALQPWLSTPAAA